MRAVLVEKFNQLPVVTEVPDPAPPAGGVVVKVEATGLCRSDWHGWRGHDPDIALPHVPGHEFAGVIAAVGAGVTGWRPGDRVTAPFVCACGTCPACLSGNQQVCERQQQPGFTHWGSFAEFVVVHQAPINLVRIDDTITFTAAAALGCRFATAFRAVVAQGGVRPGDWLAVHGCGGVGLSAVMIAAAAGARVVAVDISPTARTMAAAAGAEITLDANDFRTAGSAPDSAAPVPAAEVSGTAGLAIGAAVQQLTGGGAHVSLDALGSQATLTASIASLRRRGRHIQVGLLPPAEGRPTVPMELVIAAELEILGSHGMPAHAYPDMMALVTAGRLRPADLVTREITLDRAPQALTAMSTPATAGLTVINPTAHPA
ncbi:zinc-dependent alcohol dehydrogenase family protein [Actinoplanes sp. N902-109]|uniref:zinc-dependent alcohol dehydrogenase family protein n=1 Tax=Actinoplanes sp. (strain N902-109) TaxID=649831 RepID=UPI00059F7845|nr:zinc-dependent alcohol dehydrogenase family protein [Actinoplanes sp. N902-109]